LIVKTNKEEDGLGSPPKRPPLWGRRGKGEPLGGGRKAYSKNLSTLKTKGST